MTDSLAGVRFDVVKPDGLFFPRHFRVIEERPMLIYVRNVIESYWMTRTRFEAAIASGQIKRSVKP